MTGVLVVLENLLDMNGSFLARFEGIGEAFIREILVDMDLRDSIPEGGAGMEPGVRIDESPGTGSNDEFFPAIVHAHAADLHGNPSESSSSMRSRTRRPR
jgi:hypothetical protein